MVSYYCQQFRGCQRVTVYEYTIVNIRLRDNPIKVGHWWGQRDPEGASKLRSNDILKLHLEKAHTACQWLPSAHP